MHSVKYEIWLTTCDGTEKNPAWTEPMEPSAENIKTYYNQAHVTNYLRGRANDMDDEYPIGAYEVVCFPNNKKLLKGLENKQPENGFFIQCEVPTIAAWQWLQGKRPEFDYEFRLVNEAHETLVKIYRSYMAWHRKTDGGTKARRDNREHTLLWNISNDIVGYAVSHIKDGDEI